MASNREERFDPHLEPAASKSLQVSVSQHAGHEMRPPARLNPFLRLQRRYGNQFVQRTFANHGDRNGEQTSIEVEEAIVGMRGQGDPLDRDIQAEMGPTLDADFSAVRIHTGAQADLLNRALTARAFTTGQDIFFRNDEYSPNTVDGRELLAHELTHVVQQGDAQIRGSLVVGPPDDEYEREADAVARQVMQRQPVRPAAEARLSRQSADEDESDDAAVAQTKTIHRAVASPRIARQPAASSAGGVTEAIGGALGTAWDYWKEVFGGGKASAPATPAVAAPAAPPPPAAKNPREVVEHHVALGTFGADAKIRVTSTKRDPVDQLRIMRNYCTANRAALDSFAEQTEWLKGELDWDSFATCTLADDSVWLPFFMALFHGGGGPGVPSDKRTLPLVASPAQRTWKGKAANASPHLAGRAMDLVGATDLDALSNLVKTKIPEFAKGGSFPVRSTQIEKVSGQQVVHVNFEHPVF